jgi:hypothetical protein
MPFMRFLSVLLFLCFAVATLAQPITIGSWNSYLSYANNNFVTRAQKMIYVGGPSGLFSFNTETEEVQRINTIQGLTELEVSVVKYDPEDKALFIGYESTNIDILYQNGSSVSSVSDFSRFQVSDVYRYSVVGTKTLHDVYFKNQLAYICTSFGIVVYDMVNREVKDSYVNIGPNGSVPDVMGLTIHNDTMIYAATSLGVMRANLNAPNLRNEIFWSIITDTALHETAARIVSFNNKVYAVIDSVFKFYNGTGWQLYDANVKQTLFGYDIYNNQLITTHMDGFIIEDVNGVRKSVPDKYPQMAVMLDDMIWFIKKDNGLIGKNINSLALRYSSPLGPRFNSVFSLDYSNKKMWVMGGRYSLRLEPSYNPTQFYAIDKYTPWYYPYDGANYTAFDTLRDHIVSATSNDGTHTYIGTFNYGLIELINGSINNVLGKGAPANLEVRPTVAGGVKVTGLQYDEDGVLWAMNFLSGSYPVRCRLTDGTWKKFTINGLLGTRDVVGPFVIDRYGTKWIRTFESNGLLAFRENDLNDANNVNVRLLNDQKGQGALASKDVQCVAVDNDGEIWIGTANGVSVISSPGRVFDSDAPDSRTPFVRENQVGVPLLQYETVTAIEVDGANRKWIATRNGLWLFNSEGSKAIKNFTLSNSPLFSNNILDLELDPESGELFIATDKGLIVYKTDAVDADEDFGDVYAYPNPVRPNYTGPIAIKGLIADCIVKITDVAGNLVYETVSNGGEAIWDGNDFSGKRASSGIYLVMASNKDGTKHYQTKIAIVN